MERHSLLKDVVANIFRSAEIILLWVHVPALVWALWDSGRDLDHGGAARGGSAHGVMHRGVDKCDPTDLYRSGLILRLISLQVGDIRHENRGVKPGDLLGVHLHDKSTATLLGLAFRTSTAPSLLLKAVERGYTAVLILASLPRAPRPF